MIKYLLSSFLEDFSILFIKESSEIQGGARSSHQKMEICFQYLADPWFQNILPNISVLLNTEPYYQCSILVKLGPHQLLKINGYIKRTIPCYMDWNVISETDNYLHENIWHGC